MIKYKMGPPNFDKRNGIYICVCVCVCGCVGVGVCVRARARAYVFKETVAITRM
jgi:hypothetical protein